MVTSSYSLILKKTKTVLQEWKPEYFKDSNATMGTEVFRMNQQHLTKSVGIIKNVPVEFTETSIVEGFKNAGYDGAHVKRLSSKNGNPSASIKVTFASPSDLKRAISNGFGFQHLWLQVSEYKISKRPMQCYGCKRFGHPVKWCRSKAICGYCSSEDHINNDCQHRADTSKHCCRNCNGNHHAQSTSCPLYIERMNLITKNSQNDG